MASPRYTEAYLLWIVSGFLEQSPANVRSSRSMAELGADSFDMVELQALIEEAFGLHIEWQLASRLTFDELLQLVLQCRNRAFQC